MKVKKEAYRDFLSSPESSNFYIPVFAQPWYLDIVSSNQWDLALARDNKVISGIWPYLLSKKYGFKRIAMPPLTPFLGPILSENVDPSKTYKKNSYEFNEITTLIEQLPANSYFRVKWFPESYSWYPLYHKGYHQTTRYTYIIRKDKEEVTLKGNLRKQVRNVVCKEKHKEAIRGWDEVASFLDMVQFTFSENQISHFFDRPMMSSLIQKSIDLNQGKIWAYYNENQQVIGAIYILEDDRKAYLLYTTKNQEGREKEAVACLIWHAIKDTIGRGKDFDFEGSMLEGVEKFFRGFGGEFVPYHEISKIDNVLLKVYQSLRSL